MKKLDVKVCVGTTCTMMGAVNILSSAEEIQDLFPQEHIQVQAIRCLGLCKDSAQNSPVVQINGETLLKTNAQTVMEKMMGVVRP